MKRTITTIWIVSPLIIAAMLYGVLQVTDPAKIGPGGILVVFILLYMLCLSTLFVLLHFGVYWAKRLIYFRKSRGTEGLSPFNATKAYYIASIVAFAPVAFLALHAYSQLRWTDVALVVCFIAIATFYVAKRA